MRTEMRQLCCCWRGLSLFQQIGLVYHHLIVLLTTWPFHPTHGTCLRDSLVAYNLALATHILAALS
jgi:hypothetical protein